MNLKDISVADMRMMFQDTVVRYDKAPVYIVHISDNFMADIINIGNSDEKRVAINKIDGWDFKPITTGYVNINGFTPYITRRPRRQYKQGLHRDNMKVGYNVEYGDRRQVLANDRVQGLCCKPLYNMANKIYPSLANAVENLEDGCIEVAFDRQFAVNTLGQLYYKTELVGTVNLNSLEINFFNGMEFLRKAL